MFLLLAQRIDKKKHIDDLIIGPLEATHYETIWETVSCAFKRLINYMLIAEIGRKNAVENLNFWLTR